MIDGVAWFTRSVTMIFRPRHVTIVARCHGLDGGQAVIPVSVQ